MPFNGSGVFQRLYNWVTDRDNSVKINAPRMDAETDGIVAGLNAVVNGTQPFIGPVKAPSGTVALPGFAFSGDANTGAYNPAADQWAVALGGVQALLLNGTAMTTTQLVRGPLGSLATPSYSFSSYPSVGVYGQSNGIGIASLGHLSALFTDENCIMAQPVIGPGMLNVPLLATTVAGTANAVELTCFGTSIVGGMLRDGMQVRFAPSASNTGATTLKLDTASAISCKTPTGVALPAGYIVAGKVVTATYVSGDWIIDRAPEIISNANGRAIRYADGVQVCEFQYDAVSDNWTTASGSFFTTSAAITWTFPAAFAAAPAISATALRANPNPVGAWATSSSTSAADWRPWATTSLAATTAKSVHLTARGRWY